MTAEKVTRYSQPAEQLSPGCIIKTEPVPLVPDPSGEWVPHLVYLQMQHERDCAVEDVARLMSALREVYEVWAGMEGFKPETAPEAYQQRIIEQMRDAAKRGFAADVPADVPHIMAAIDRSDKA